MLRKALRGVAPTPGVVQWTWEGHMGKDSVNFLELFMAACPSSHPSSPVLPIPSARTWSSTTPALSSSLCPCLLRRSSRIVGLRGTGSEYGLCFCCLPFYRLISLRSHLCSIETHPSNILQIDIGNCLILKICGTIRQIMTVT